MRYINNIMLEQRASEEEKVKQNRNQFTKFEILGLGVVENDFKELTWPPCQHVGHPFESLLNYR